MDTHDAADIMETLISASRAVATQTKIKNWLNPNENVLVGGVSWIARIMRQGDIISEISLSRKRVLLYSI